MKTHYVREYPEKESNVVKAENARGKISKGMYFGNKKNTLYNTLYNVDYNKEYG